MKRLLLSLFSAIHLFGNSYSIEHLTDGANKFHRAEDDEYSIQPFAIVGDSESDRFTLSLSTSNIVPVVNVPNSVITSEEIAVTINISYSDDDGDSVAVSVLKDGDQGNLYEYGDNFMYVPHKNKYGADVVTLQFDDGNGGVVQKSVSVRVLPVDDPPALGTISDVVVEEDSPTINIPLSIYDIDSSVSTANISVISSNPDLVTVSVSDNSLHLSPNPDQYGESAIYVTVTLGTHTIDRGFIYKVTSVDDEPILNTIERVEVKEDSGEKIIELSLFDIDSNVSNATFMVDSASVTFANVELDGNRLKLTPNSNQFGDGTITVTASVDGKDISQTFEYSVTSVDDLPVLLEFGDVSNRDGTGTSNSY
jgi:hypothetical protein